MIKKNSIFILVFIFCQLIASSNYAASNLLSLCVQRAETKIVGTVTDEEGTPLPGVVVEAKSPLLMMPITVITDIRGQFQIPHLAPGIYTLTFTLEGFGMVVKENICVELGKTLKMDTFVMAMEAMEAMPPALAVEIKPQSKNIHKLTLPENLGITPVIKKKTQEDKGAFYYLNKKIYAKEGIAKVGFTKKKLYNITEIPFEDKDYIRNGLTIEKKCVYAIRIGEEDNIEIMLIRVLKIINNEIKIEYYIWAENE